MSGPGARPTRRRFLDHFTKPAWLYPFKGIYYLLAHPFLYPLLKSRLLPALLLSLFVYGLLFGFCYLPQVALLALWQGRGAWVNAAALVLGEGLLLVALVFEAFFVDETQVDLFDAVLLHEGQGALVSTGRILLPEGTDPVQQLGKPVGTAVYAPFSFRQIVEFVFFLPFNFVPIIGTPVFLLLTGYRAGPFHHWRYFRLLGLTKQERRAAVKKRKLRYTWFGTSALILQLVPGFSLFFLLSTAVGSALWVVDLERTKYAQQQAAVEPEYTDDPV